MPRDAVSSMEWMQERYDRIKHLLPIQRGNVEVDEGDSYRAKVEECGMIPVVPPKSNRKE